MASRNLTQLIIKTLAVDNSQRSHRCMLRVLPCGEALEIPSDFPHATWDEWQVVFSRVSPVAVVITIKFRFSPCTSILVTELLRQLRYLHYIQTRESGWMLNLKPTAPNLIWDRTSHSSASCLTPFVFFLLFPYQATNFFLAPCLLGLIR